jgi:hypothetical protein
MEYDYIWTRKTSDFHKMAEDCGLKLLQPIMCSTRKSGNCLTMFQSGSKHYFRRPIEGDIWEIVTQINKLGLRSLKLADVPPMWT